MENDKLVIKVKKYKGEDGFKTFSVRIREDIFENLNNLSAKTNRSRNDLIGLLLEFALEKCDIEE